LRDDEPQPRDETRLLGTGKLGLGLSLNWHLRIHKSAIPSTPRTF
jgi:hypothetical protein